MTLHRPITLAHSGLSANSCSQSGQSGQPSNQSGQSGNAEAQSVACSTKMEMDSADGPEHCEISSAIEHTGLCQYDLYDDAQADRMCWTHGRVDDASLNRYLHAVLYGYCLQFFNNGYASMGRPVGRKRIGESRKN